MNNLTTILQPPALDIDNLLGKPSPQGKLERRIVCNLIAHLHGAGFEPRNVFDGETETTVFGTRDSMELIFSLDEASLRFWKRGPVGFVEPDHGVLLILGNGIDVISDWNYTAGDPDGFNAAMDAFDPEDYA
jgi:hypothetical protein